MKNIYDELQEVEPNSSIQKDKLIDSIAVTYQALFQYEDKPESLIRAANLNNMVRHLHKKYKDKKTFNGMYDYLKSVNMKWIEPRISDLKNRKEDFKFKEAIGLMKEYEYKMDLISEIVELLQDLADKLEIPADPINFSKVRIVHELKKARVLKKIPIEEGVNTIFFENQIENKNLILQFVEFGKFIAEYDTYVETSSGKTKWLNYFIDKIEISFSNYFKDPSKLEGKYDFIIQGWKNMVMFGAYMGPLIKERLRIFGFQLIYHDSYNLLKYMHGIPKSVEDYTECYINWKKAYILKFGKNPPLYPLYKPDNESDNLIYDSFTLDCLQINKIHYEPSNFKATFKQIEYIQPDIWYSEELYFAKILDKLCSIFLNEVKAKCLSEYYNELSNFLIERLEEFEPNYKILGADRLKYDGPRNLGKFVKRYCPDLETFVGKYWIPKLIKIYGRDPLDFQKTKGRGLGFIFQFNTGLSGVIGEKLGKFSEMFENAVENKVTMSNNCEFVKLLVEKRDLDIEVAPSDMIWIDDSYKKEWNKIVQEITDNKQVLENDNSIHYVTIGTPLKTDSGEYVSVQTNMHIAAILNCFNDKEKMQVGDFIKKLKVTKKQSQKLFKGLHKLFGSNILIKDKNKIMFNYNYDCSKLESNIIRI